MNKQDVIDFFDRCAPTWDAGMIKSDKIIGKILDNVQVEPGMDVLDVACGTGVMFPYYLDLGVNSVTGIDISPEMARIAGEKYADDPRVRVICGDVEESVFDKQFDVIVVYNAFPHFPDPRKLIKTLAGLLKEGGRLTVAHGQSREAIDGHHKGPASKISNGLMSADSLRNLFAPHLQVEVMISDNRMYQVAGIKLGEIVHAHGGFVHSHDFAHEPVEGEDAAMEELLALMKFTVTHNDAHAQELVNLAQQLQEAGKVRAYQKVMDAVANFDVVNAQLDGVVKELSSELY